MRARVAKICGADIELANCVRGREIVSETGREASRALLREIVGIRAESIGVAEQPRSGFGAAAFDDPQDWGRVFLPTNGGCCYIDLDHLEMATPEVTSARDHVAVTHAMLRIARDALERANAKRPPGERIQVLVNNSDGLSHSFGSHLSFLVTRAAYDQLFEHRLHYLLFLASHQVSSQAYTGQGKVGAENGRPWVPYQISQRADFFETLVGPQTTHRRPLVNARDEALCGPTEQTGLARLHCIFYDSTLCHGASLLKVGAMQTVLAMIEAGAVRASRIVEDPVTAALVWSHDPELRATCRLLSGRRVTAVEHQLLLLEDAQRALQAGVLETVPEAASILALWESTLTLLCDGDLDALTGRLDWVLKLHAIERARRRHPQLRWDSPAMKHLDHLYSSLDPAEGLYWAFEAANAVERVVDEESIERFTREPPDDTRAFTRAMLLRIADSVERMDWDRMSIRLADATGCGGDYVVHLDDPTGFTRDDSQGFFDGTEDAGTLLRRTPHARTMGGTR